MNRVTNPLLMIIPESALGPALMLMIVVGGLVVMVGKRAQGFAIVLTAIAIPFINFAIELLMNDVFDALPDSWVTPVSWLIMAVAYLALAISLIVFLVGEKVWREAMAHVVAAAIKGTLRILFWSPFTLIWLPVVAFLVWRTT